MGVSHNNSLEGPPDKLNLNIDLKFVFLPHGKSGIRNSMDSRFQLDTFPTVSQLMRRNRLGNPHFPSEAINAAIHCRLDL